MDGDIDYALDQIKEHYPDVLRKNELLDFRLHRRKLVEMIREVAELTHAQNGGFSTSSYNGNGDIDHDMDIDDPANGNLEWGGMEVEEDEGSRLKIKAALDTAVEYGQQLRVRFSSDSRPEIKKPLEEAFSLLAYTDPKSSVLAHLLDEDGRIAEGEELNSAILGKPVAHAPHLPG